MKTLSKAAFWSLWCFVLVLPWDAVGDLPVVGSIPRLVGLAASAVGIAYILARRRVRPLSWFLLFGTLFVLWAGVSTLWSIAPDVTWARFTTYLQLLVLAWLIWEIAWSVERGRSLLQAYVLGASAAAVLTITNYLAGIAAGTSGGYVTRFAALHQNPNELGLVLTLGIPMAWYVALSQPYRRTARLWQSYLPLAFVAILLTASRGALVTMLVALAIVPATQRRLRLRTKVAVSVFALASLVVAVISAPDTSLERLETTQADIEAGHFGGRITIWRAGVEVAREHPLVGVGAGAFGPAVEPDLQSAPSSHDVLLSIAVEGGAVGLSLFLAMVAAVFKSLWRLPLLQRRFGIILLLALAVGSIPFEWQTRKHFWFVLAVLATAGGTPLVPARRVRGRAWDGRQPRPVETTAP